ncbi:MAG: hypothetical protein WCQ50_11310 [Spirochaetota bacterium]
MKSLMRMLRSDRVDQAFDDGKAEAEAALSAGAGPGAPTASRITPGSMKSRTRSRDSMGSLSATKARIAVMVSARTLSEKPRPAKRAFAQAR